MSKSITLSCGIKITDNRELSLGFMIENINTKHRTTLCYSKKLGFYLNLTSSWLVDNDISSYVDEIETMKQALIEAKESFATNKKE